MTVTETDRDIEKLIEPFKIKVKSFLSDDRVKDVIFVTEAYRTQERQEYLYNLVPKVTWTLDSMHTKGLAIDIAFKGPELYPSDINKWIQVTDVAKEYGIDWGYDLWNTDKPHLQDNLKPMETNKYKHILDKLISEGYEPLFNDLTGTEVLNEGEVKTVQEIAFARFEKILLKLFKQL